MIRRWLGNAVLFSGSVLAACAVGEIALRAADIANPVFYVPDEATGFSLRPNAEGWWTKEGRSYVRINSAGLRDLEHSVEKPVGTYRIAVLGDSYAEALQLPLESAFWKVMERALQGCPNLGVTDVEVINFGVTSYGTAQQLVTLQTRVKPYRPDLVVLAFVTGNDVRNNHRELELDPMRPYFVQHGANLRLDDSFRDTFLFRLATSVSPFMEHLYLLQLADTARIRLKHALVRRTHKAPVADIEGEEPGLDSAIYRAPQDPRWIDAWAVTEALLERMHDETTAAGSRLLVVTLSNGIQVHPEKALRERFMKRLQVGDLFYPENRLSKVSQRAGFSLLTLAPNMQRVAQEKTVLFHGFDSSRPGFGHWNEAGHLYAGEYLAETICKHGAHFGKS